MSRVVKSNRRDWKWQKYEIAVIKRLAKRTENKLGCTSLGCVKNKVCDKNTWSAGDKKNILAVSCKEI
ncbi:hypothetical protein EK904_007583 [Melospiza melodia maxima]|nr:hypothetical protein EK904_007583 [Melospiza melodia maxima]